MSWRVVSRRVVSCRVESRRGSGQGDQNLCIGAAMRPQAPRKDPEGANRVLRMTRDGSTMTFPGARVDTRGAKMERGVAEGDAESTKRDVGKMADSSESV